MSDNLTCLYCSKSLIGRQTKFCSSVHRMRYKRAQVRVREGVNDTVSDEQTGTALLVTADKLNAVVNERDKALAIAAVVTEERDYLRLERDKFAEDLTEEKVKSAVLETSVKPWKWAFSVVFSLLVVAIVLVILFLFNVW